MSHKNQRVREARTVSAFAPLTRSDMVNLSSLLDKAAGAVFGMRSGLYKEARQAGLKPHGAVRDATITEERGKFIVNVRLRGRGRRRWYRQSFPTRRDAEMARLSILQLSPEAAHREVNSIEIVSKPTTRKAVA